MASSKTATLAKFGLGGVLLTIATAVVTTLTATTGTITTLNSTTFRAAGTMSGASTLTLSTLGAQPDKLVCIKAGGVLGYVATTATGTLVKPLTCL